MPPRSPEELGRLRGQLANEHRRSQSPPGLNLPDPVELRAIADPIRAAAEEREAERKREEEADELRRLVKARDALIASEVPRFRDLMRQAAQHGQNSVTIKYDPHKYGLGAVLRAMAQVIETRGYCATVQEGRDSGVGVGNARSWLTLTIAW